MKSTFRDFVIFLIGLAMTVGLLFFASSQQNNSEIVKMDIRELRPNAMAAAFIHSESND